MAGLSAKLTSLVKAAEEPSIYLSVLVTLDGGSPMSTAGPDGGFPKRVYELRMSLMRIPSLWYSKLQQQQREMLHDKLVPLVLDQKERQLAATLFQQSSLEVFIRHLPLERPEALQKMLQKGNPLVRLLAIYAIGRRHLHFETNLIERLNAPNASIREAAHAALVRVARGTDFGPIPGASQRGIARSIEKWRQWLALQQSASPETLAKGSGIAADKPAKDHAIEPIPVVLERDSRELNAVLPEAAKRCEELVNAKGGEQMSVLARLRDAKGIENTDALALAIPKLSGDIRKQARDALTQRLTRMTAATLRDKLQEDSIEVRCAAALACGRKNAKEHIPDLLQLLDDPEGDVLQAVRVALSDLTGQDFGPAADAGHRGRAESVSAWRKWWKERQSGSK